MGTWNLRGGSGGTKTTLVWDFDNGATATNTSVAPGGRVDINGSYPVKISGISLSGDNIDYIGGNGTYYSSSNFDFTVTAGNTGGQNRYLRVNIAGSGTIYTYTGGGSYYQTSWSRSFTGTFNFDFVNTSPTSNVVSRNVRDVTVTASGAGGSDAPAPSSYTVQYNDNAGSGWVGDATSPATFTGLTRGRTYSFRSWANNAVGSSSIYTSGSVYIPNLPSAPTGVIATTSTTQSNSIDIRWTAAVSDALVTGYKVYTSDGTLLGSPTPATGLTFTHSSISPRGASKSYYVVATSQMGDSSASVVSAPAIASSVPSAPSSITTPQENSTLKVGRTVTINHGQDANGYSNSVTAYRIQLSTDDGLTWRGWDNATKSFTASGTYNTTSDGSFQYVLLTPALTYKWRVYGVNAIGIGDAITSPTGTFVGAGGRRYTGTAWEPTATSKRFDGTNWVDFTNAKRFDGTNWVDLT